MYNAYTSVSSASPSRPSSSSNKTIGGGGNGRKREGRKRDRKRKEVTTQDDEAIPGKVCLKGLRVVGNKANFHSHNQTTSLSCLISTVAKDTVQNHILHFCGVWW
jgi:hypothetical protein